MKNTNHVEPLASDGEAAPVPARPGARLWSDGTHFIRRAGHKDRHPFRFVLGRINGRVSIRHTETLDEAIAVAERATKVWLKAHPEDTPKVPAPVQPEAPDSTPVVTPTHFVIERFICIHANPAAQVWRCEYDTHEIKKAGRPFKNGARPQHVVIPHLLGEHVVMMGDEPVRLDDGTVRVFHTAREAFEFADEYQAHHCETDDGMTWAEGSSIIYENVMAQVRFEPDENEYRTFTIFLPPHNKYAPAQKTKLRAGVRMKPTNVVANPALQLAIDDHNRKAREWEENKEVVWTNEKMRYRTLSSAIEAADTHSRNLLPPGKYIL